MAALSRGGADRSVIALVNVGTNLAFPGVDLSKLQAKIRYSRGRTNEFDRETEVIASAFVLAGCAFSTHSVSTSYNNIVNFQV